jgi:hypothetical protein
MNTFSDTFDTDVQTTHDTDIDNIDNYFRYDSKQDIEKCLSCNKPECTNCLRYRNGV